MRFAIPDSQQPTSPIGFLFLKLPPPPCALLLVLNKLYVKELCEVKCVKELCVRKLWKCCLWVWKSYVWKNWRVKKLCVQVLLPTLGQSRPGTIFVKTKSYVQTKDPSLTIAVHLDDVPSTHSIHSHWRSLRSPRPTSLRLRLRTRSPSLVPTPPQQDHKDYYHDWTSQPQSNSQKDYQYGWTSTRYTSMIWPIWPTGQIHVPLCLQAARSTSKPLTAYSTDQQSYYQPQHSYQGKKKNPRNPPKPGSSFQARQGQRSTRSLCSPCWNPPRGRSLSLEPWNLSWGMDLPGPICLTSQVLNFLRISVLNLVRVCHPCTWQCGRWHSISQDPICCTCPSRGRPSWIYVKKVSLAITKKDALVIPVPGPCGQPSICWTELQ